MLGLRQLPSYSVDIHYALRRIRVSEDLRVEFAQSLCLVLCELVSSNQGVHLLNKAIVRFLVAFCIRQVRGQSRYSI